ncbi:hypothetical protein IU450_37260 [Nocardia abscessus]|uniref:hypothetical protein n=1 Tax=Nocardia abscessus TaxID=120957 RepID=UPI00189563F9|nr:hypothetical protein [Nocardia abscessus]MBF6341490.1 hypothetical protein [Nocardia abscessus]
MRTRTRRLSLSASVFATAVLTCVPAAPEATAAITGVSVAAGPEGLAVGCSYTVTATVDTPAPEEGDVTFLIAGGSVPGNGERLPGPTTYHPESGTATITWTPKYRGSQNLIAQQFKPGQYTSTKYIPVDVNTTGINTGSSCLTL